MGAPFLQLKNIERHIFCCQVDPQNIPDNHKEYEKSNHLLISLEISLLKCMIVYLSVQQDAARGLLRQKDRELATQIWSSDNPCSTQG